MICINTNYLPQIRHVLARISRRYLETTVVVEQPGRNTNLEV